MSSYDAGQAVITRQGEKYLVDMKGPQVANVGVIVKAMHEHGLLSLDEFKKALKWGELPLIVLVDSTTKACGTANSWYGCTRNDQEIEVDTTTLQAFEKGGDRTDTNAKGQNVYVLGATILHELAHWGHKVKGVPETKGHAGDLFEMAVYGKSLQGA